MACNQEHLMENTDVEDARENDTAFFKNMLEILMTREQKQSSLLDSAILQRGK